MPTQSYLDRKNDIYANVVASTCNDTALLHSLQYNMVSASLTNFLPEIPFQHHLALYKQILYHQQLSMLDQSQPERLDDIRFQTECSYIMETLQKEPSIIATFHTGSYRLLNLLLLRHQIPFSLVLATEVLKQQGTLFSRTVSAFTHDNQSLDCIDAESPQAALKMMRALRAGRSLVIYIDGNTGSATQNDNLLPISFLKGRLLARKGISIIAHLAGAPIHCLATYYPEADQLTLKYFGRIIAHQGEAREDFVYRSLQTLYQQLAHIVLSYPGQWEGWLYLHKSVQLTRSATLLPTVQNNDIPLSHNLYTLNSGEFAIFITDEQYFLLHKRSYTFFLIDRHLFECLSRDKFEPAALPADQSVLTELLASGVITPACLPV